MSSRDYCLLASSALLQIGRRNAQLEGVSSTQLAVKNESELLKIRSFGKTSLREVKRKLQDLDLSLGMKLPGMNNETVPASEG